MVRTFVIPRKRRIALDVPNNYIGKRIEILLYSDDDFVPMPDIKKLEFKITDFKGILSEAEADSYQQYLRQARTEWDRVI